MLPTYPAVLRGDRIEWSGDAPGNLVPERAIKVHVTLIDELPTGDPAEQGRRMAAALEKLARLQPTATIPDPAAWERDLRTDRPLPTREE